VRRLRPLGPLFDAELSDDEAMEVFRARKLQGTADEAMFLAQREMVIELRKQNGLVGNMQASLNNHLDKHPVNEIVEAHLEDAHDARVTARFIKKAGGWGTAGLALLITVFGGAMTVLQIIQLSR